MPLPVSAQTYIPNPLASIQAAESGFSIGKQSSKFANFVKGAMEGIGFADKLQTNAQARETDARTQDRADQQQALQEEKFDFESGEEFDLRVRQTDIQQQVANDNRANAIEKNARLRTGQALRVKDQIADAEYNSAMASAIADGNPDPLIAALGDPNKRANVLEKVFKDNAKMGQAAIDSLQKSIADGRIEAGKIPAAQAALDILTTAPGLATAGEKRESSASLVEQETGFRPQRNTNKVELAKDPVTTGRFVIKETRADGTSENHPVAISDPNKISDLQKALNQYNQQTRIQNEITNAVKSTAESKAKQRAVESQSSTDEKPTRAPATSRTPLSQLGTEGVAPTSTTAKDSLRAKLKRTPLQS